MDYANRERLKILGHAEEPDHLPCPSPSDQSECLSVTGEPHGIAANETQTNSTSFLAKTPRFANAGGAQAHFF